MMSDPEVLRATIYLLGAMTLSVPYIVRQMPAILRALTPSVEKMAGAVESATRAALEYWQHRNADVRALYRKIEDLEHANEQCEMRAAKLANEFHEYVRRGDARSR